MNEKLSIITTEYDIDNVFFVVKKDNKNLYVDMGFCHFVEEMEYWDIPLKCGMVNGEAGFIVSKEIDIEDVKMEIERFIIHNDI